MALFSNKIESVKFVDYKEKTIEVLYKQKPDSETLSHYIVELNYDNQDFLDLMNEYSIEDIQDSTQKYHQNLIEVKNNAVHNEAKKMFDEWVQNAQRDLDKQDVERYEIFEKYKEKQLETFQSEAESRYKEVEAYKEEQLKILQAEVDEQVERRIAEGFVDVDEYREKQLAILQAEIDEQIQARYGEVEKYKESEIKKTKEDLLSKFNKPSAPIRYTPEKVAEYIIDNFENEDMVFKTKLAIFNLPEVKNNQDREIKMKVRKAKSIPELFAVYNDIQHNHS